jgi:hypothetical protein
MNKPKLTTSQLHHYLQRINNGEKLFERIENHFELKNGQILALKFSERLNNKIK